MQTVDTLIHAEWIITVDPDNTVLAQHAIAIHDGRIVDILPSAEAREKYQSEATHHLENHALIPGLINAHTHAAMTLFRGLADDLHLMEWLQDHIWPAEGKWVSDEFVYDGTMHAAAEMLRSGTTCFNDMYFFPDVTARVIDNVGMRAVVGLILIDFPTVWASDADEYISKGLEVHDHYRSNTRITTAFAPHAPYTVSDDPLQRIETLAEELDLPIHIHVHETEFEVKQAIDQTGLRPLSRLNDRGIVSPRLMAVHMTQLTDDEIELLATSNANVVHCPESNLKLASGYCPVQRLTAQQALRMATINGAQALGLDELIGSLEVGKAADIVAIDMGTLETQPLYHVISQLVYSTSRNQVRHVWVAGQQLLKDNILTTIDDNEVLKKSRAWREKIFQSDLRHQTEKH
ncbi:MAG: N-ethylammeline chlorohydrolase [Gammaproteobacteria bacterium SG8_15]|nr:MAG: N-ethylammeline chlorohydrolase [Gammaproteobacteria bacterium SG8_15]